MYGNRRRVTRGGGKEACVLKYLGFQNSNIVFEKQKIELNLDD